jgi:hypothetical protein
MIAPRIQQEIAGCSGSIFRPIERGKQESIDLYSKISVEHSDLKETMPFLIDEEHKQLIEKEIT